MNCYNCNKLIHADKDIPAERTCCGIIYYITGDWYSATIILTTLTKSIKATYYKDDDTTYIYCNEAYVHEFRGNELFKTSISDIQSKIDNIMILI